MDIKAEEHAFDIAHPFEHSIVPLSDWINTAIDYLVLHFRDTFLAIKTPIDIVLQFLESSLLSLSPYVVIAFFVLITLQFSTIRTAIGVLTSFIIIGVIGVWDNTMITLAIVFTSVLFSISIGIPLGIMSAKNDRVESILRVVLDTMQTTPAFVYLIPVVMLFGIGNVPGVIVTIIFCLPPLIRLTSLGIRQVPKNLVEAAQSFGASPKQMLFKVELPIALPTIMTGINQTLMLALSMVVIASMISVGGLGQMVLRGIGRLDVGLAALGGIGIVLLAIILDRITQEIGNAQTQTTKKWFEKGPIGMMYKLIKRK